MCELLKDKLGNDTIYKLRSEYSGSSSLDNIIFSGPVTESSLVRPFQFKNSELELKIDRIHPLQ